MSFFPTSQKKKSLDRNDERDRKRVYRSVIALFLGPED